MPVGRDRPQQWAEGERTGHDESQRPSLSGPCGGSSEAEMTLQHCSNLGYRGHAFRPRTEQPLMPQQGQVSSQGECQ